MKRILFLLLLLTVSTVTASAEYGEMDASIYYTHGFKSGMDGVGLSIKNQGSVHWRKALSIEYRFKKNNLDGYAFNYELNYLIEVGQRLRFYPAVGSSIMLWQKHGSADDDEQQFIHLKKSNEFKLGLRGGAGVECLINEHWLVMLEGRYLHMFYSDGSLGECVLSTGISYRF